MNKILELINDNNYDKAKDKLIYLNKINDNIIQDNNFIHICAIRGNNKLIDYIDDKNIDKYKSNGKGENILHLLLKYGWDELALELIEKDDKYLDYSNLIFQYPIIYCINRIYIFNKILDVVYNKYPEQINIVDTRNKTLVSYIIMQIKDDINNKYFELIKKIKDKINFNLPEERPILIHCILNKLIYLSKYLIENSYGINSYNKYQLFPIHAIIELNNYNLLKELLNNKDFDRNILNIGGLRNDYLPLILCFKNLIKYKNKKEINKMIILILNKIKNFNIIDENKNTYAHYIADLIYIKHIKINKKISDKILKKSNLNYKNIIGITPNNIIDNNISNKCILPKINKIVFPEINKQSGPGIFVSDILHNMIYTLYLLKKYNNIIIPINNNIKYKEEILRKLNMQDINYSFSYDSMRDILLFGYDIFYQMMPYIILWKDDSLNWMDDNLIDCLKSCMSDKTKKYILLKVTIITKTNNLHANIVLFDKEDNSYRRFEPYGNLLLTDELNLDKRIIDIFTKLTHKKIKYYKPSDYLEEGRFQSISNDGSSEVRKVGDPMGFCLAWCFWYIEIRLKNINLSEKELINMAAEKIFSNYCDSSTPYNDFIRDYGRMLNKQKDIYFDKFKINKNDYYDIVYKNDTLDKVSDNINNELEELKLI